MLNLPTVNYRARLERVISMLDGQSMLLFAQPQGYRNSTVEGPWRQDALFYYLTGFSETDAALLILSHREPKEARVILFLRVKDPVAELWNGLRMGVVAAKEKLAIDEAYGWDDLWTKLPILLSGSTGLQYALGGRPDVDQKVVESLRKLRSILARNGAGLLPIFDPSLIGGALRLYKGPEEISRMQAAAEITRKAFAKILSELNATITERDVHATIMHEFLKGGAEMEAYGSIVAGGDHACVLHYRDNDAPLKDGELILIDAGCQVDNYASDVTRTFPINGKFKPAQRALYDICLKSQKAAIAMAKPGSTLVEIQDAAFKALAEGLIEIGLIKLPLAEALEKNAHKHFCPHSISHWIGLDVHDAGLYMTKGKAVLLEPGMYFSVEPGIYINSEDTSVPAEYRGIGIRIEDDVLITESGHLVLTGAIPKEISEIER
jgi:Xaa-Pro aminopeptidase